MRKFSIFLSHTVEAGRGKLSIRKLIYYQKFSASQRKVVEGLLGKVLHHCTLSEKFSSSLLSRMTLHPTASGKLQFSNLPNFHLFRFGAFSSHLGISLVLSMNIPLSSFPDAHTIDDAMATFASAKFSILN